MDGNFFLMVETLSGNQLADLQDWLPVGLTCESYEKGSNVWLALAIAADAVEAEMEKRCAVGDWRD